MRLTTRQIEVFSNQYVDPLISIEELSRQWGAATGTIYRWGFELGLKRPERPGQLMLKMATIREYCQQVARELEPTEPVKVLPADYGKGRALTLVLWLCDLHGGRLTHSYDAEVFGQRFELLTDELLHTTMELRKTYTLLDLVVFGLGDFVTGERVGEQISLEELEHTILTQVYNIVLPRLVLFSKRVAPCFRTVSTYCVRGNHGALSGKGSKTANWDTVAYLAWQAKMAEQQNMTFDIATTTWYNRARVMDTDFMLIHGDQVRGGFGGKAYNGIAAKEEKWHQSMPFHFDYVACGHWHHYFHVGNVIGGPTFLSDDDWSREVLGRDGDCGQLLLGIGSGRKNIEFMRIIDLKGV